MPTGWEEFFEEAIEKTGCKCQVYQPIDLKISENTVVNPDLLIVGKPIKGQALDTPPEFVIEIISPQSKLKDTITKYDLYQEFGIPYYVLIDPAYKGVVVYELLENTYQEKSDTHFEFGEVCSFTVKIEDCFL